MSSKIIKSQPDRKRSQFIQAVSIIGSLPNYLACVTTKSNQGVATATSLEASQ